ncbi:MAG: class II glutamine amidotransferase [Deltaproteobacteria bacterium]|nr:class II glutamine amidotransferase [Deltaproteobacteria bacterium]
MSRLFGCMCSDPERLRCTLYGARESLVTEGAPLGWGLAFFQGGEVLLQRHPKPVTGTLDFFAAVKDLRTDYVVGHVRENGAKAKLENTQPYRFRSWVFAHSGSVEHFDAIQAGLLEHIPDFLRRNVRGQTDSEHVFHLFLAFLHDAGKLDDTTISTADTASALSATTLMLDRLVGSAGGKPIQASMIACNGRIMVALRRGRPMWLRKIQGIADCPVCREQKAEGGTDRRRFPHEHLRSVLVVGEPKKLGPEGWEEVPEASIVAIARDLTTSIQPIGMPAIHV